MRLRRFLGAVLLAASAPAMADMYLFDERAWIGSNPVEQSSRAQIELAPPDQRRESVSDTMFSDRTPPVATSHDSRREAWRLRHDPNLRPSS